MTIAVDIKTGAVVGQVLDECYWRPDSKDHVVRILTRDGIRHVPATSVRVEEV